MSAQRTIDESIARAEQMQASAEAERDTLLRQLAVAQNRPVAEVTQVQDQLDERVDDAGPSAPPDLTTSTPKPAPTQTPEPADPPPASGNKVEQAIVFARAQLGEKYRWGGAGPSSWDCSGLTMRAWQAAGVRMSHYAGSQYTGFTKVSVSKIKRGDVPRRWSDDPLTASGAHRGDRAADLLDRAGPRVPSGLSHRTRKSPCGVSAICIATS